MSTKANDGRENGLRRIWRSRSFLWARRSRFLNRVVGTAKAAQCTQSSLSFFFRDFARPGIRHTYLLRDVPFSTVLRHNDWDADTLFEIFGARSYEPPERIRDEIARNPNPRVLDLGANIGLFGLWAFGTFPDAKVVSYEPDPSNVAVLREAIRVNRLGGRWSVIEACAATENGTLPFVGGLGPNSHVYGEDGTGPSTSRVVAKDVFADLMDADFVKLDIEGAEWPILRDDRFRSISARAMVLEYHPAGCPAADAQKEACAALAGAGFTVRSVVHNAECGVGLLWGYERTLVAGHPDPC